MEKYFRLILILAFIFCNYYASAQYKYEREYRIKAEDVPALATAWIKSLDLGSAVKWYAEESQDGKTIEATGKIEKKKLSIEFDTSGKLLDVEIEIDWCEIDEKCREGICKSLHKEFLSFRIKRIQLQYSGEPELVRKAILHKGKEAAVHYEMILKAKKSKSYSLYECLFDEDGKLVKVLEIVHRSSDIFDY